MRSFIHAPSVWLPALLELRLKRRSNANQTLVKNLLYFLCVFLHCFSFSHSVWMAKMEVRVDFPPLRLCVIGKQIFFLKEQHFCWKVSIRSHYYDAFALTNASFFSSLPAQREKSCVIRLYFLPQNKKINTDKTAAPHSSTFLSLFCCLSSLSSYRSIICVLPNRPAEFPN